MRVKGTPVMEATVTRGDEESWKKVNEREIREREREREKQLKRERRMMTREVWMSLERMHEVRVCGGRPDRPAEIAPPLPEGAVHLVNVRRSNVRVFLQLLREKMGPFEELCVISVKDVAMTEIIPLSFVEVEPASISGELDVCI